MEMSQLKLPLALWAIALSSAATAAAADSPGEVASADAGRLHTAYTQPSKQRKLAFKVAGIVREVPVKEGDTVKKGDLLVALDERVERKLWESATLQAESVARLEAAAAELRVKQVELKRIQGMYDTGVAKQIELEQATLAVDLATQNLEVQRMEQAVRKLDAEARGLQVEQMLLTSPIDGQVARIDTGVGELADSEKPAIFVVQNDPLEVVMYLPNAVADKLGSDQVMQVRYGPDSPWLEAKVVFLSPVADAQSFKRQVKLELANPGMRAAGYEVQVLLPASLFAAEAAARGDGN